MTDEKEKIECLIINEQDFIQEHKELIIKTCMQLPQDKNIVFPLLHIVTKILKIRYGVIHDEEMSINAPIKDKEQ